jgi:hypothetical protein
MKPPLVSVSVHGGVIQGAAGLGLDISKLVRGLTYNIGIFVGASSSSSGSPQGWLNFSDVAVTETEQPGLEFEDKAALSMPVTFSNCSWSAVARSATVRWGGPNVPLLLHQANPGAAGGVLFEHCKISDLELRPWLKCDSCGRTHQGPATRIMGTVTVDNKNGCTASLGANATDNAIKVRCNPRSLGGAAVSTHESAPVKLDDAGGARLSRPATASWQQDPFAARGNLSFFPHFSWRARVVSADPGPVAAATRVGFFEAPLNQAEARGTGWSAPRHFGNASVAVWLQKYPNSFLIPSPWSNGFADSVRFESLVTYFTVANGPGTTSVELELRFDEGGPPVTLAATLLDSQSGLGAVLGVMLGRGPAGRPRAETMREFNARRYWSVAATLPALEAPPRRFLLADAFEGDDDAELWREGIAGMSHVGLSMIDANGDYFTGGTPLVAHLWNFTRPMIKRATGTQFVTGGSCMLSKGSIIGDINYHNSWSDGSVLGLNASARAAIIAGAPAPYLAAGFARADVTLGAMIDEPRAGTMAPLPPVGNASFPLLNARWGDFLRAQGLRPADLGASAWAGVRPLGRPPGPGSVAARRLYYWTTRFIAWDATTTYAAATQLSRAAFGAGVGVFANLNNWPGRFYYPGPTAATSWIYFDWLEFGRLQGASFVWSETKFVGQPYMESLIIELRRTEDSVVCSR